MSVTRMIEGKKHEAAAFFTVGGTLNSNAPSYVRRKADVQLFEAALDGEFCYVLTARQLGKSSLMVRTAQRLRAHDVGAVIIDLTQMGTYQVSPEQWYLSLLTHINRKLELGIEMDVWWMNRNAYDPVKRFTDFLRDEVLMRIDKQVVIFIDEIDSTLHLEFTDDFFAAIRAMYNSRADDPVYKRLSFVMLGVATPSDLIKDHRRTPFNIGRGIELNEFSYEEAAVLREGVEYAYPEHGRQIFDRIFHWSGGHPYLTQKLCRATIEAETYQWNDHQVDQLVESMFLTKNGQDEINLKFVRDRVAVSPRQRQLLKLYRQVLEGKQVPEDKQSITQNQLRLFGLVKVKNGILVVRNRIYQKAFDRNWIKETIPVDWPRRITILAVFIVVVLAGIIVYNNRQQTAQTDEALAQQFETEFNSNTEPLLRLNSLANLVNLDGFASRARTLFSELTVEEQQALFAGERGTVQSQVRTVVRNSYVTFLNTEENNRLLSVMQEALAQSEEAENVLLANEIEYWLDGREAFNEGDYATSIMALTTAIGLNEQNPALYFDRGLAYVAQEDYAAALASFDAALSLNLDEDVQQLWAERIVDVIRNDGRFYDAWWRDRREYANLEVLALPTPTNTPAPTDTLPATSTVAPTNTQTVTPTFQPSDTPTPTLVPSNTPQPTSTPLSPTPTSVPSTPTPSYTPLPGSFTPNNILVDASKDGGVWWYPQSEKTGFNENGDHNGKVLADHLRALGYSVTELPQATHITFELLAQYEIVIRAGEAGLYPHSSSERAAYLNYVNAGGNLLLISSSHFKGNYDILAESFGITIEGVARGNNLLDTYESHPITIGATTTQHGGLSGGITNIPESAIILGYLSDNYLDLNDNYIQDPDEISPVPVLGAMTVGNGKIVFSTSIYMWWFSVYQPLVNNTINWLSE